MVNGGRSLGPAGRRARPAWAGRAARAASSTAAMIRAAAGPPRSPLSSRRGTPGAAPPLVGGIRPRVATPGVHAHRAGRGLPGRPQQDLAAGLGVHLAATRWCASTWACQLSIPEPSSEMETAGRRAARATGKCVGDQRDARRGRRVPGGEDEVLVAERPVGEADRGSRRKAVRVELVDAQGLVGGRRGSSAGCSRPRPRRSNSGRRRRARPGSSLVTHWRRPRRRRPAGAAQQRVGGAGCRTSSLSRRTSGNPPCGDPHPVVAGCRTSTAVAAGHHRTAALGGRRSRASRCGSAVGRTVVDATTLVTRVLAERDRTASATWARRCSRSPATVSTAGHRVHHLSVR